VVAAKTSRAVEGRCRGLLAPSENVTVSRMGVLRLSGTAGLDRPRGEQHPVAAATQRATSEGSSAARSPGLAPGRFSFPVRKPTGMHSASAPRNVQYLSSDIVSSLRTSAQPDDGFGACFASYWLSAYRAIEPT
jgi:hypothetical protein